MAAIPDLGGVWCPVRLLCFALPLFIMCFSASTLAQDDPFASLTDAEALELLEVLDGADRARDDQRWEDALSGYLAFVDVVDDEHVWFEVARMMIELERISEAGALIANLRASVDPDVAAAAARLYSELAEAHPAVVTFGSLPPGATVGATRPDGSRFVVQQGDAVTLPAGRYLVELSAPGYRQTTWAVDLHPGEIRVIEPRMIPVVTAVPAAGRVGDQATVQFRLRPRGARVEVSGRYQPYSEVFSRETLAIEPGVYQVRVSAPGYATHETWLELNPGQAETLEVSLLPVRTEARSTGRSGSLSGGAIFLGSASAVTLVASAALFGRTAQLENRAQSTLAGELAAGSVTDRSANAVEDYEASRRTARATLGVGVGLSVVALAVGVRHRRQHAEPSLARLPEVRDHSVAVGIGSNGLSISW